MYQLGSSLLNFQIKNSHQLIELLKRIILPQANQSKVEKLKLLSHDLDSNHKDPHVVSADELDKDYLTLLQEISFLRCLSVQLTLLQKNAYCKTKHDLKHTQQSHQIREIMIKNLPRILSLAVQDPVRIVTTIFSSDLFKGVQLDVLKNLLKEGDITFLEKIVLRLWKQYKGNVKLRDSYYTSLTEEKSSLVHLAALAGEVVISDAKIRALTHFPSLKLLDVALERMTGRWFYECTLLSDGLMQIGWANASFRCDPVCGQGVGDHIHSWAYDGLRSKKWNVSCEPYGRRWKLGDIVGVMIDMDLLEIRFYLNGEDLGPAFEDFSGQDIFPALSLNVRQSVRLNFGQYKFLYPPDECDGKAYKAVLQFVVEKNKKFGDKEKSKDGLLNVSKSGKSISLLNGIGMKHVLVEENRDAHHADQHPSAIAAVITTSTTTTTTTGTTSTIDNIVTSSGATGTIALSHPAQEGITGGGGDNHHPSTVNVTAATSQSDSTQGSSSSASSTSGTAAITSAVMPTTVPVSLGDVSTINLSSSIISSTPPGSRGGSRSSNRILRNISSAGEAGMSNSNGESTERFPTARLTAREPIIDRQPPPREIIESAPEPMEEEVFHALNVCTILLVYFFHQYR
jgi:hypothetical protein